jgi:hypothetical protein
MKEITGAKKERNEPKLNLHFFYLKNIFKGVMFSNRANDLSGLVSVLTGGE